MSAQNSSDPACPAPKAVNRYTVGRLALVYDATNLMEKSCVKSAVHSPSDATSVKPKVAYTARSPLRTRSARPWAPPANETVAAQAAIRRATQSASSPARLMWPQARGADVPCWYPGVCWYWSGAFS